MATKEDPARQAFLAMMIQELSRQQSEDAASFAAPPPPVEDALFRKMCFDYPEISDESLNMLVSATSKWVDKLNSGDGAFGVKTAFEKVFCLHDTFVENVVTMCSTLNTPVDGTTNPVSTPQGKHKLAAVLFLRIPKLLLHNNTTTLLPLLNTAPNTITWKEVLLRFQAFVALSTVSIIASGSGGVVGSVQQLLTESSCLADLCSVIESLGTFLTQAEQLLSQITNTSTTTTDNTTDSTNDSTNSDSDNKEDESLTAPTSTLATSINLLDSFGTVTTHTTSTNITSLYTLLQALLTNATNTTVENTHTQMLSAVVTIIKSSWLHLTFLCRDLLLVFPVLIPTKASALLNALHKKSVFSVRKSDFPTSAKCLYVLVLSSLSAHVCSDSSSGSNSGGTSGNSGSVVVLTQAKDALRMYLENNDTLSTVVSLCARMNKYTTNTTTTSTSTTSLTIDAESSGFLIDLAHLYLAEPNRVRAGAYTNTTSTVPSLVSSQLLSTLLFTLIAVLQQVCADREKTSVVHTPTMLAFTARLGRFFSLLPVGMAQRSTQPATLQYVLHFPDLLPLLSTVCDTDEVSCISTSESGVCVVSTLFTPVQALGVVVPLLLAAHSTSVQLSTYVVPASVTGALLRDAGGATSGVLALLNSAVNVYRVAADVYLAERENSVASTTDTDADTTGTTADTTTSDPQPLTTDTTANNDSAESNLKQRMASDKANDSSDSDSEEKQSIPIIPPSKPTLTADSAAATVHKKALHSATTALIATINSLVEVLSVVVGDGAGGAAVRLVCAVHTKEQPPNRRSMNSLVHNTLLYFSTEAVRAVQGLLGLVARNQERMDGNSNSSSSSSSSSANTPLVSKAEVVKKALKGLQELLQGGSNKGD